MGSGLLLFYLGHGHFEGDGVRFFNVTILLNVDGANLTVLGDYLDGAFGRSFMVVHWGLGGVAVHGPVWVDRLHVECAILISNLHHG